jgi:hypothetical protein
MPPSFEGSYNEAYTNPIGVSALASYSTKALQQRSDGLSWCFDVFQHVSTQHNHQNHMGLSENVGYIPNEIAI